MFSPNNFNNSNVFGSLFSRKSHGENKPKAFELIKEMLSELQILLFYSSGSYFL